MSQETLQDLNRLQLISMQHVPKTDETYFVRQHDGTVRAWHFNQSLQGAESNHYEGFIPVEDVNRRLFNWEALEAPLTTLVEVGSQASLNLAPTLIRKETVWLGGKAYFIVEDPSRKVISRSDTGLPLGVFRDGYRPHPYSEWLIDNVASILSEAGDEMGITSAGLLKNGAVAYVQITPQNGTTVGGDKLVPLLTAAGSFDGSMATHYTAGTYRVACDNSLSASIFEKGASRVSVRHTRNSGLKLMDAREALGVLFAVQKDFEAGVERMLNTTVSDDQFWAIVGDLYPIQSDASDRVKANYLDRQVSLNGLWNEDDRVAPYKGTAWGAFQAHSTYDQHVARFRSTASASSREERNVLSTVSGTAGVRDGEIISSINKVLVGV